MDSLTQIALGAAVGHATLGRRAGRRALLWGAALGILPDLDVLVPMGDAVADYTNHRSWSHSLPVLTAAAPVFGWLAARFHRQHGPGWREWTSLAFLVLVSHVLLDCFTVYGTQIFWPLPWRPESWSTIFIIDPVYTLPLLGGVAAVALRQRRSPLLTRRLNLAGLVLSTLYLGWTVGAKLHVEGVVAAQLTRSGVHDARVLTTPAPFNTLLWRVVLMREGGYAEGYYSLVADSGPIRFTEHPSDEALLEGLRDHAAVDRLRWFTHGFCSVSRVGDEVVISDLRMGLEPDYVFRFAVARIASPAQAIEPRQLSSVPRLELFPKVWRRIWDSSVSLR